MVRQRGGKAGPGGARRCLGRKDSSGSFMETKEEGRHSTTALYAPAVLLEPYARPHMHLCSNLCLAVFVFSLC